MPKRYPTEWAEIHDAHAWLLPFEYKVHDPWQVLIDARDYFETLHEYAATWSWSDVGHGSIATGSRLHDKLAVLLGGYQIASKNDQKYVNPEYAHDMNRLPTYEFEQHLRWAGATGIYTAADVGRRYGLTKRQTANRLRDYEFTFLDLRAEGRERMANTLDIVLEWSDWRVKDLAEALDMGVRGVYKLRQEHRTLETIPDKPTGHWTHYQRVDA